MRRFLPLLLCLFAMSAAPTFAQESGPVAVAPDTLKWSSAGVPPGTQVAVVSGDPSKPGPYVIRVKFAPNTAFPLHSHPGTESVTVLTGTFGLGFNTKLDRSKGIELGAGSFVTIPPNAPHFAWSGDRETIVQLHGMGPFVTTPVVADKS